MDFSPVATVTDRRYFCVVKLPNKLSLLFRVPLLTRTRIVSALAVAVLADGLQLLLGPLGWAFVDQAIDGVAMLATMWLLGFHLLLLPTFMLELVPVLEDLPTWTACVAAVIVLRKRDQRTAVSPAESPSKPPVKPVIDI